MDSLDLNTYNIPLKQYFQMLRIRRIEESIAAIYPKQEIRCPVHLCIGQEAVAAGVCGSLTKNDWVFSSHRSHGHYLAKGGDLGRMLAEMLGRQTGCCKGRGGSMHLIDLEAGFQAATPIVASTIPIAVGAALASKMRGEPRIVAVFFGEGATEEGAFLEALNFAAMKQLPVLFVCENNLYSVYSPLAVRQAKSRSIVGIAIANGVNGTKADGNNLQETIDTTNFALSDIMTNQRPNLIEFTTYRFREHCGPDYDNQLDYRSKSEYDDWASRDPITLFERSHLIPPELKLQLERKIQSEWDNAIEFATKSEYPSLEHLTTHVYASTSKSTR